MEKILFMLFLGSCANAQSLTVHNDINFTDIAGWHYITTANEDSVVVNTGEFDVNSNGGISLTAGASGAMQLSTQTDNDIDLSAGGNVAFFPGSGYNTLAYGLVIGEIDPQPTCDATQRGRIYYSAGGTGVADVLQVCMKNSSNTYSWVTK